MSEHRKPTIARADGTVLSIEELEVDFTTDAGIVAAVKGVSFDVAAGEVVAVVGESGSGKSVTARTVLGLLAETATARGAVVLRGRILVEAL